MKSNEPQRAAGFRRLRTLDVHTGGEPLRIVTAGYPDVPGETMLAKRRHARREHDDLRRALVLEPRGHADMYACVLTPPVTEDGDLGVLFLHNEGYSTMCGHGIVGLVTAGLEWGLVETPSDGATLRIDTPAGRVTATAEWQDGRVGAVAFDNVASFVQAAAAPVKVEGLGTVVVDLAFGGAFYAYVDAAALGFSVQPAEVPRLVEAGRAIKAAVAEQLPPRHPEGPADLDFVYGVVFVAEAADGAPSRNVCIFAEGEVDRSPTGTGVSGRAAIHHARGDLGVGEAMAIDSIVDSRFTVAVARTTTVGATPGIVPRVRGSAFVTGRHEFLLDPEDPLGAGFLLR